MSDSEQGYPGSSPADAVFNLPPVHKWTVDDCCTWLTNLKLEQYSATFRDKQIDGLTLLGIDNEKDIQVTLLVSSTDHQREMLYHLNYLRDPETADKPISQNRVALEPLANQQQSPAVAEAMRKQQLQIKALHQQIEELRREVSKKGSNVVAPSPGLGASYHVKHGAALKEAMSFDAETGKPLNQPAFTYTDEEKKQRPRFDTNTGVPVNKAAEIMVQQQLVKKTFDTLNIVDFDEENFVQTSLCCLDRDNSLRHTCLRLMHWKSFDKFILLCIGINALIMGLADYRYYDDANQELLDIGWRNKLSLVSEPIFTAIFTLECVVKVIAMGFFMGRNTYLREPWNILDFLVVVTAIMEILPGTPKLTALRTFRVLRPLRSIARFPELNTLVKAILNSVPQLLNVFAILLAMLSIFAILAVQVFGGDGRMYGRCRLTPFPVKFSDEYMKENPSHNVTLTFLNNADAASGLNGHSLLAKAYYSKNANGEPYAVPCLSGVLNVNKDWSKGGSPWNTPQVGCAWPIAPDDGSLCNLESPTGGGMSGRKCPHIFRSWLDVPEADKKGPTPGDLPPFYRRDYYEPNYLGGYESKLVTSGHTFSFEDAWMQWCGSDYDNKGNPRYVDERVVRSGIFVEDLNWGFTSMNHVPAGILALFQCATLEGWTDVMYSIGDAVDHTFSICFFIMLVLMGGMFVLNLILAVIEQSFGDSHEGARKDRLLARFIKVFQKLDEDGSGYLTIQELMTTDEFGHMTFGELNQIVKDYDQNFDGKISQEEFVELMMAVNEGELELMVDDKQPAEDEANTIMCISFNSAWCFRNNDTMYRFVTNPWFERFIIILILVNTLVLSLYKWPQDASEVETLDAVGFVLTIAFAIEMACKLSGLGVFQYLNDSFNLLDGLIVIISLIELGVAPPPFLTGSSDSGEETDAVGAFSALRTVRLFRIFKLMTALQGLRSLVRVCLNMLSSAVNLGALVMLFMYIFSILGMQLFARKFHFSPETGYALGWNETGYAEEDGADIPRSNFDSFVNAFLTVFQILTGEDWNVVMYTARRAAGDAAATIYFTIVLLLGNFVLLNLFLAILLGGMENDEEEDEESGEEEVVAHHGNMGTPAQMMSANASKMFAKPAKVNAVAAGVVAHTYVEGELDYKPATAGAAVVPVPQKDGDGEATEEEDWTNNATVAVDQMPPEASLMIFTKNNPFRKFCAAIVFSQGFDKFIILAIGLSSILLAIDNPLWDPESQIVKTIAILDMCFTYLFMVECVLKVITLGFIGHPNAYLRISWNQLDFFVVALSIISMVADGNDSLSSLRSLRSLRALRPLRVISRYPGLKQVVNACFASIPGVFNASIITGIAFLMFAIIAVSYFKGMFYACQGDVFDSLGGDHPALASFIVTPSMDLTTKQLFALTNTNKTLGAVGYGPSKDWVEMWNPTNMTKPTSRMACEMLGAEWSEINSWNYNNVGSALLLLFEVCTTEGWVDVMYTSIDAVGVDMQPIKDYNIAACLFYIVFLVACSFFLMNLFVGVIIDNFNDIKKQTSHSVTLTPQQQQWVNAQKMLVTDNALFHLMKKPRNGLLAFCWNFSSPEGQHTHMLDKFIMVSILVNTFLMALKHFGQTDELAEFMVNINYVFALIYTFEAVIKVLGLGFFEYWRDNWNKFDFILVVITDIGLVVFWTTGLNFAVLATVCRTFRVGRILRLVRGASGARAMFNTLVLALPALINISSLLLLLFFIYAVMGVQLFAKVKMDGNQLALDEHANFQTFGMAMLTLLRCATGEFWNGLMYDFAVSKDCTSNLEYNPNMCGFSEGPTCIPINGCGSAIAFPYFVSFTLIITFVTIELFTAVIMDGFESSSEQEKVNRAGKLGLTDSQYHEYCRVWLKYDPHLKWVVNLETLTKLLQELPAPVGIADIMGAASSSEQAPNGEQKLESPPSDAESHYTYIVDVPVEHCGIRFGSSPDGSVVVTASRVIGVDDGDVLLTVKPRTSNAAKDVTSEPAKATLDSLSTMKVPVEITLLRRQKTWIEVMKSYGMRQLVNGKDSYEFHCVAKALSKKVLLEQTGDDPRRVIENLEKSNKEQLHAEEAKQEAKWQDMKSRINHTVHAREQHM